MQLSPVPHAKVLDKVYQLVKVKKALWVALFTLYCKHLPYLARKNITYAATLLRSAPLNAPCPDWVALLVVMANNVLPHKHFK